MTTTIAHQPAASPATPADDPPGPYQVIVTYEDSDDFDGDWRWSADCPAIGCASCGRTREEALLMVADAIQCLLSDYPPGEYPPKPADAMAQVQAEYEAEGWSYTFDEVTLSGPNPYR